LVGVSLILPPAATMAEGAGFEPACGLRHGGFQVHCLAS
jgi:hypothetical protein